MDFKYNEVVHLKDAGWSAGYGRYRGKFWFFGWKARIVIYEQKMDWEMSKSFGNFYDRATKRNHALSSLENESQNPKAWEDYRKFQKRDPVVPAEDNSGEFPTSSIFAMFLVTLVLSVLALDVIFTKINKRVEEKKAAKETPAERSKRLEHVCELSCLRSNSKIFIYKPEDESCWCKH